MHIRKLPHACSYQLPIFSLSSCWTRKVLGSRPVHGSVWVGFVPNPESTRLLRVYHFWTRRRPVKGFGSDGRTWPEIDWFSVGVEICKTTPNSTEIHRILLNSPNRPHMLRSGQTSMRSRRILTKSGQISTRSHWISQISGHF